MDASCFHSTSKGSYCTLRKWQALQDSWLCRSDKLSHESRLAGCGKWHLFQALAVQVLALNLLVQVGDIGLMVLPVVDVQGLLPVLRLTFREILPAWSHDSGTLKTFTGCFSSPTVLCSESKLSP